MGERISNHNTPQRVDVLCVSAIRDIVDNMWKKLKIKISFREGSRLLGEKYFKGNLKKIPYDELKERYKHGKHY